MGNDRDSLTERDHDNLDDFLGRVLDGYKGGTLKKVEAIGQIAHVIAALDAGEYGEVRKSLERTK